MYNYLLTATKSFSWDCAHMLAGHRGLCKNLHGHTYKLEITVARRESALIKYGPSEGMIVDFKDLKDLVQEVIVTPFDHATVINASSDDACEKEICDVLTKYEKKILLLAFRPTAENMCKYINNVLMDAIRDRGLDCDVVKIRLYETPTSYAEMSM